jgi:hypothetical protein
MEYHSLRNYYYYYYYYYDKMNGTRSLIEGDKNANMEYLRGETDLGNHSTSKRVKHETQIVCNSGNNWAPY